MHVTAKSSPRGRPVGLGMAGPAATTSKAIELLEQAARERAELVVFLETLLSGYPFGVMLGAPGGSTMRATRARTGRTWAAPAGNP